MDRFQIFENGWEKDYRMKTSHEKLRGVKTKNWIRKIPKLSKSEYDYWKKYLEDNEKRLIKRILDVNY
jgi:hypothetical protein